MKPFAVDSLTLHATAYGLLGAKPAEASQQPENSRIALLEVEAQGLRRDLKAARATQELIQTQRNARGIPARVLPLAGGAGVVQRVLLDRGARDGVSIGLPVLADGVLVGRVEQATTATCEVRLVTDPGFRVRATVPRPNGPIEGMLSGTGEALVFEPAVLDETAPAPQLLPGDRVTCSRASVLCGLPALLGNVVAIERRPGAPLPEARVHPACDLRRLRQVIIVRAEADPTARQGKPSRTKRVAAADRLK